MEPCNLIVIMSDEHDPRFMGHMGHPRVRTPNMDRLAARGTAFAAAYTNCPICVPARASFATGRYVHKIGYWDNAIAWDGRVPGWPGRLQAEGLYNATIGKLHYRRPEDPYGIDRQIEPMHIHEGIGMVWGSQRDPVPDTGGSFRMLRQIGPGESGYNRYDGRIADAATAWLREAAGHDYPRPWVLYIGFVAPHFPLVAPQKYFDPYPVADMPFPKLHPRDGYRRHPWVEAYARFARTDLQFADDGQRQLAIAAYHALCTFVDERIGTVLDTLDETGLGDTTRVIYTSDHGDNVGARGLWGKSVLYEEASRIPMIVAGPEVPAGRTVATPVSLVDIYPTVIDAVGLAPTEEEAALPGRSLFALLDEADDPERIALSEYHAVGSNSAGFMLRRGRYKYHHYVGHAPELFDLAADPEELVDLAPDPAFGGVVAEYEGLLRGIVDPEDADRRARADQRALIERFGGWEAARKLGAPGATPAPGAGFE